MADISGSVVGFSAAQLNVEKAQELGTTDPGKICFTKDYNIVVGGNVYSSYIIVGKSSTEINTSGAVSYDPKSVWLTTDGKVMAINASGVPQIFADLTSNTVGTLSELSNYNDIKSNPTVVAAINAVLNTVSNNRETALNRISAEESARKQAITNIVNGTTSVGKLTNALKFGDKTYNGSSEQEITAKDLNLDSAFKLIGNATAEVDCTSSVIKASYVVSSVDGISSYIPANGEILYVDHQKLVGDGTNTVDYLLSHAQSTYPDDNTLVEATVDSCEGLYIWQTSYSRFYKFGTDVEHSPSPDVAPTSFVGYVQLYYTNNDEEKIIFDFEHFSDGKRKNDFERGNVIIAYNSHKEFYFAGEDGYWAEYGDEGSYALKVDTYTKTEVDNKVNPVINKTSGIVYCNEYSGYILPRNYSQHAGKTVLTANEMYDDALNCVMTFDESGNLLSKVTCEKGKIYNVDGTNYIFNGTTCVEIQDYSIDIQTLTDTFTEDEKVKSQALNDLETNKAEKTDVYTKTEINNSCVQGLNSETDGYHLLNGNDETVDVIATVSASSSDPGLMTRTMYDLLVTCGKQLTWE